MRLILVAALALVSAAQSQTPPRPPAPPPKPRWKPVHVLKDISPLEVRRLGFTVRATLNAARKDHKIDAAATPFFQAAQDAIAAQNVNLAWRLLVKVLSIYQGLPPDDSTDAAASLLFRLDRRILAPGMILHPRLDPLFLLEGKLPAPLTVRVWLEDSAGKTAGRAREEKLEELRELDFSLPTANLPPGRYTARYALNNASGQTLAAAARNVWIDAALRDRALALRGAAESLARADAGKKSAAHALAFDTVAIYAGVYERAVLEGVGLQSDEVHPASERLLANAPYSHGAETLDPENDLALSEQLISALPRENNPLARLRGGVRLASAQATWRLFIPAAYDPAKKWPVVLALHTGESDEGFLMRLLAPEAAPRGYFVLAPASYTGGDWNDADARQAHELLATLRGVFSLEDRAMLLGAGQGTAAAFRLAWSEREAYSALAAFGGALRPFPDFNKPPELPVFYRYGENDALFTEEEARAFAAAINYRITRGEARMLDALDRHATLRAGVKASFEFFDAIRAGSWKPLRPGRPVSEPKR
jgi:dienelactone hydrolase